MLTIRRAVLLLSLPLLGVCTTKDARVASPSAGAEVEVRGPGEDFKAYWFTGKAELNRYRLEQARYGEIHEGDAVLVFVTEHFLTDKQVKADEPDRADGKAVPVLKLNLNKSFLTGVYPYSMMTSVFTPVRIGSSPATLKVTTSVQEWCGQTWTQLNLRDGRYRAQQNSYFEREGDGNMSLDAVLLEDELWTRIRIAPERLPVGEVRLIPGSQQSRLRHRPLSVERAVADLRASEDGKARVYTVRYPESERTLSIRFGAAFPHEVMGWEETYRDGFGPDATMLTTRATRTHKTNLAYWEHTRNEDRELRESLGLPF